ncbi:Growth-regulating factor [Heracleum sosnowskyi]|uniref:Growth-regulating factor n=1 Tax=Heracleum sosnowskyi TaxID=360622 RepID=A0AAD8IVV7_9APIA|nr:Growth-regulating factor [Heracleum sosnowskyi]
MATTALGYPGYTGRAEAATFTRAQWKELERQAMIYKYIVASVPVPPHLLSSDITSLGNYECSSIYNLNYGNNKDAEPWRCKRTDGKKWRCSRDVAPHQKYCDRHMHRGKPRSRKPVEQQQQVSPTTTNKKTRHQLPQNDEAISKAPPAPQELTIGNNPSSNLLKNVEKTEDFSLSLCTQHPNRDLDWMMESKMIAMDASEQQWHQLMSEGSIYHTSTTDPSIFQHNDHGKEQKLNLLSIPEIGNSSTDEYNMFLNPYYSPRDFVDAWSNDCNPENDSKNESSGATIGNLSPSSLNLSMSMAVSDSFDSEMVQFGKGEGRDAYQRCHGLSWLSPVSWMGSTSGGPLAEVLRPISVADGDAISPLAPSVSSPSGVLQRAVLSLSDSSVCNSPTGVATSTAAPEIVGFQWLN